MTTTQQGTAGIQGKLWGTRAEDWATQEVQHIPLYREAIARAGIGAGASVLDVGSGAGTFARLAADAGARVTGIDASPALLEIARRAVPSGDFRVGDLQFLPYDDGSFDVVTAFNSIQYAANPVAAAAEAKRVAKPSAPVFVLVWGREERTEMVAILRALRPLLPPAPSNAPGPFALSQPGVLEDLLGRAGLSSKEDGYLETTFDYADEAQVLRATLSSGPGVMATQTAGEAAVLAAAREALAPYRTSAGGYSIETEWRYVLATA